MMHQNSPERGGRRVEDAPEVAIGGEGNVLVNYNGGSLEENKRIRIERERE